MIRIGFDGRALASPAAGMRRYTHELFGALAQLDPLLSIVAVGVPAGVAVPAGIELAGGAASLPTNLGWMLTGLPRAARRARVDVFHAPSYTAPIAGPRPLVLTIHDVSYERNPEWYPYKRDPMRRAFYRYSARTADRVITDSEFSKQEIVEVYSLRPESIQVVPLAASRTLFARGHSSRCRLRGRDNSCYTLATCTHAGICRWWLEPWLRCGRGGRRGPTLVS